MRVKIDQRGIGNQKEDWWYLGFDEERDEFYIEHEWHHFGMSETGRKKLSLAEMKKYDESRYDVAINYIKEKLFRLPINVSS